jgi:hypothetical protein
VQQVFTPQSVGDRRDTLTAVQIGGTWLYGEDVRSIVAFLDLKSGLLMSVLKGSGVSRYSYLAAIGRKALSLGEGDYELVRALLNYTCARGGAIKLLCRDEREAIYASYVARPNVGKVQEVVDVMVRTRKAGGVVRFKELAAQHFGGVTGSYYWAKGVAEHLVYLGLMVSNDKWSVRSN